MRPAKITASFTYEGGDLLVRRGAPTHPVHGAPALGADERTPMGATTYVAG